PRPGDPVRPAVARRDAPGVYVAGAKVASVGLRIRRHWCYHGMAVNVALDLEPFTRINPCGHSGLAMNQLSALGGPTNVRDAARDVLPFLLRRLGYSDAAADTGLTETRIPKTDIETDLLEWSA
ncbi:MAG: hypothetical protein AAFU65_15485, partial [Pseudomonadota bacterium]